MPEKMDKEAKKEFAKIGMTASLGLTATTAFFLKNRTLKYVHTGAGLALVGFSLWHHLLYQADKTTSTRKSISSPEQAETPTATIV